MKMLLILFSIVFLSSCFTLKDKIVRGKVISKYGKPLSGVNVVSYYLIGKDSPPDKKVITDTNGNYQIKISRKDKFLHFEYYLFRYSRVTAINDRANVNIILSITPSYGDTFAIGKNTFINL